ncbi:hypothetical protein GQ43DRAFT_43364 [Delitschia confertaspora ATCC 74209]|uniref:Uncharacterized protein n=1 Tax=Delitschia confertaspora ATCC 74209 TaxID=1513339 RepID=A0A9P4N2Y7_9PLEO|nr:hypothetical protein GQ43DRAFT_43364 [Delitschia confertaspora ATCC 74209]
MRTSPTATWAGGVGKHHQGLPKSDSRRIFQFAGRDASFQFGLTSKAENAAAYTIEGMLEEPFNYWDWARLTWPQWNLCINRRKKWLCLGKWRVPREDLETDGYHLGKKSLETFKAYIENHWGAEQYVRNIAISHWMIIAEYEWIQRHLKHLERPDLSDLRETEENSKGFKRPQWEKIRKVLRGTRQPLQKPVEAGLPADDDSSGGGHSDGDEGNPIAKGIKKKELEPNRKDPFIDVDDPPEKLRKKGERTGKENQ